MRTFSSEFAHSYETYSFGYCNYAIREKSDNLADIYAAGYLPYSGSPDVQDIFYMTRSARLPLNQFTPTSENRRILKRFDGENITRSMISLLTFKRDETARAFCIEYFSKRHGKQFMPQERLETILDSGLFSEVIQYRKDNHVIGYVFEVTDRTMTHFWFSFYDLDFVYQSLGMWLMLDSARCAKRDKKKHFYIGTVYGEKALYKLNLPNIEYWNGSTWIQDAKKLKTLARNDYEHVAGHLDEWKHAQKQFSKKQTSPKNKFAD